MGKKSKIAVGVYVLASMGLILYCLKQVKDLGVPKVEPVPVVTPAPVEPPPVEPPKKVEPDVWVGPECEPEVEYIERIVEVPVEKVVEKVVEVEVPVDRVIEKVVFKDKAMVEGCHVDRASGIVYGVVKSGAQYRLECHMQHDGSVRAKYMQVGEVSTSVR